METWRASGTNLLVVMLNSILKCWFMQKMLRNLPYYYGKHAYHYSRIHAER